MIETTTVKDKEVDNGFDEEGPLYDTPIAQLYQNIPVAAVKPGRINNKKTVKVPEGGSNRSASAAENNSYDQYR